MKVYPAIDLKDGTCVRLVQGSYQEITIYAEDPVGVAKRWEAAGAEILHLVDLDGAKDGVRKNNKVVEKILREINIPVQLGGGMRDSQTIKDCLKSGVSRVIIGTAALTNPIWFREMLAIYGDKIVLGVDCHNGLMALEGWQTISDVAAITYIKKLEAEGLQHIVYTDISKDGMLKGPNFTMYEQITQASSIEVIASGGVSSLGDLKRLKELGLQGVIIGKALYEDKFTLGEALLCLR